MKRPAIAAGALAAALALLTLGASGGPVEGGPAGPADARSVVGEAWIDLKALEKAVEPHEENGRSVWEYELVVQETELTLFDGTGYKVWAYGGTVPGPPLLAREGDLLRIRLVNETSVAHTIHSHGMHLPARMDGVPHALAAEDPSSLPEWTYPVAPGASYTYEYIARPAGTHFYHCHMTTAEHLDRGMSGLLVVLPREEEPPVDRDVALLLDEWNRAYAQKGVPGAPGDLAAYDVFTLNGRSFPDTEPLRLALGEVARIRLINVGALPHFMHLHGNSFLVTHRDGARLAEPVVLDTVEVGPGQRVDILVVANNPGLWPFHCHSAPHVTNAGAYPGGMLTGILMGDDPFPSRGDGPRGRTLEEIREIWRRGEEHR